MKPASINVCDQGYEKLKFWKVFGIVQPTLPTAPSSGHLDTKGRTYYCLAKESSATYFAKATTTTSNDSIIQQRHQAPLFTSNTPTEGRSSLTTRCSAWKHADANNAALPPSTAAAEGGGALLQIPPSPVQMVDDESVVALRAELAKECRRTASLQKQYEAMSQKTNHLHALLKDKTIQIQKLESDKNNREQDMDLLLQKTKSVAEDARKWSFEASRYKQELEALRQQLHDEKRVYMTRLRESQDFIQGLPARLGYHSEECGFPLSSSSQPSCSLSASSSEESGLHPPTPLPGNNHLDREFRELTREKEQLQSLYAKIPLSGVNRQIRQQKQELEDQLDKVDGKLSHLRQYMKRVAL